MSIVAELLTKPGVIAAGEYAYRGDRFSYRGNLTESHARMASIMCRATTMSTHMQGEIIAVVIFPQLPSVAWLGDAWLRSHYLRRGECVLFIR
ncbi:MAG: DUF2173 family protein [Candidatus Competibacteraceae bacterium]|nr:DUF2173 family protein [Candidatus Competibacteraceae bacterium]